MTKGFDNLEFEIRVKKARELMEKNNIDILLLTTPHNFRYFSGLDSYFWESPTRPWFLLIPQNSDPIALVPSIGQTALEKTWLTNIKTWSSPNPKDEGITLLKETVLNLLPNNGIVGCELGHESHLRMSINDFDILRKDLSKIEFINASKIIWELRMIKSHNEIKKIKKIISLTSNVFDNLPKKINIGMSEIEICNIFKKELIENGAEHTLYISCASDKGGYDQIICSPSNKKVEDGDILIIDTGSTFDGYFCDFDRNFAFGNLSDETRFAHETVYQATDDGFKAASPGNTTSDVWAAMWAVLEKGGAIGNSVGRMGHGLGMELTEWPSVTSDDNTLLEPGMILTLEPGMTFAPGKQMVHEENIVITEEGARMLSSRAPSEMPIIQN